MFNSTGHPKRLARINTDKFNGFGSHEYSKEELVAEFGAAFMCEIAGIDANIESSAAYIRSWSEALKSNPDWIVSAVSKASRSIALILNDRS